MNYNFLKKLKLEKVKGVVGSILKNVEFNYKQDKEGNQNIGLKVDKSEVKGDVNLSVDKNNKHSITAKVKSVDDRAIRET